MRSGSLVTALPIVRSIAASLACVIAVPQSHAAPAPEPEAAPEAAPDTFEEAEALYEQGRAKFETADYTAAIELWTEAYRRVADVPEGSRIKALLIYNIATAREHAFDVTQDPSQLRQAKILLESFEESIPDLYPEQERAAETEKVRERIAAIDARLRTAEPETPEPEPEPEPIVAPAGPEHPGRPLVIAGAVLVGVGVAGLAVMGAGLGIGAGANDLSDLDDDDITGRRDQFARGRSANAMAIGGGVAGGLLAITGAVLLGLGLAKNRRATPTAWLAPGSAGVQLSGRF